MKFEVFKKREPESVQMLDLVDAELPTLVGVNSEGEQLMGGRIALITAKGTLHLYTGCAVPGIQTDDDGRIIVD